MSQYMNRVLTPSISACRSIQHWNPQPFDSIPGPKLSLPFIGTNWIYLPLIGHYKSKKLHEANLDKFHRYGPIMKEEYQRGYPSVTIFDPSDIRQVLMREGTCPSRPVLPFVVRHRKSDPKRYPNVGLANMMGQEWFELRSQLAPLLLSKELKRRHIGLQNRVSTSLVSFIDSLLPPTGEGPVSNIQEVFYRFSMESIMNLCINKQLGCLNSTSGDNSGELQSDSETIFQAAMDMFEAQHKLHYGISFWKFFETKGYKQLKDSQNAIYDISSKYIDIASEKIKGQQRLAPTPMECDSLLETLYRTKKFDDLEVKSIIVDFIGGGIYTVANTLTMTLFLLASNPLVQEKLYREINQVFDDDTGGDIEVDMEKLEKLKFLKFCLKESYRLLPTIPGIARTLQKDLVLSNYIVPKDTLVFCNFMVTCRLPQYYENPDVYNPSRWERNGKMKGDLAFSLLPFGHGVRKCIGHNFAELEIYVALIKLLKKFRVETINGEDAKSIDLCYKFIVVPEKPITLNFSPRNSKANETI